MLKLLAVVVAVVFVVPVCALDYEQVSLVCQEFEESLIACEYSDTVNDDKELSEFLNSAHQISRQATLINEIGALQDLYDSRKTVWGDFLRFLKNGSPSDSDDFELILDQYSIAIKQIQEAYRTTVKFKEQLQVCLKVGCSQARNRELEDHIKIMENLLNELLVSHPLLVSEKFIENLEGEGEIVAKEILADNLTKSFQRDSEIRANLSQMKALYLREESEKRSLCNIALTRKKQREFKKDINIGLQSSLIALSLFPAFSSGSAFRSTAMTIRGLSMIGRVGFTATMFSELQTKKDECSAQASMFLEEINLNSFERWKSCHNQVDYLELSILLSALPVEAILAMPATFKKIAIAKGFHLGSHFNAHSQARFNSLFSTKTFTFNSGTTPAFTIQKGDITYTAINLSKIEGASSQLAGEVADNYWNFVATVESRSVDELLPFEKPTGYRHPRGGGKSIELVRLTSSEPTSGNMQQLLNQVARTYKQEEPNLQDVFVYTSKAHVRLYRRLGVKGEIVHRPNSQEVILRFSRDEMDILII